MVAEEGAVTRRFGIEVERVMAEVIAAAVGDRSGRSAGDWYLDLVGMLLPLPVAIPSLRTFERRLVIAGLSAGTRQRRKRRFTYAVHHTLLDLMVVDASGANLGKPLVTLAVRIDTARPRPVVVASRMEVSYPTSGEPLGRGR
jgi:hypothetical protein